MKKLLSLVLGLGALSGMLVSCNNVTEVSPDVLYTYDFNLAEDNYNSQGYWVDVYSPEIGAFGINELVGFSHRAQVDTYDGIEYKSFTGFCPTIVNDTTDYSGQDWTQHQFGAIAKSGGYGYLIAHWDVRETEETPLTGRSCLVDFFMTVRPVAMTVSNSSYAYWVMKNGSAFSKPFTSEDYLILDIYGVHNGVSRLAQSFYLVRDGKFVEDWQQVSLLELGDVEQMYFTMRSSDTGAYGMNVPAYFALGGLQVLYPGQEY